MTMKPWRWRLKTETTTQTLSEPVSKITCGHIFPSEQLAARPHRAHYAWKHLSSQTL